jgi:hypothetical protein
MVKPSAAFTREVTFSLENQQHITMMFDYFKNDLGQEFPAGEATVGVTGNDAPPEMVGNDAPPEYDGESSRTTRK